MSITLLDEWQNKQNNDSAMKYLLASFPLSKIDIYSDYFQIQGENELGFFAGYILVNEVMNFIYPQKNIDWQTVPNQYLINFFSQEHKEINLSFSESPMSLAVGKILLGNEIENLYPIIDSNVGAVLISDIKGKYQWRALSNNNIGIKVYYCLGHSAISLSLLKSISIGDILLVDNLEFFIFIDDKKWIGFSWNGENSVTLVDKKIEKVEELVEKENIETNSLINSESENMNGEQSLQINTIGTIPLSVSFLLASKVLPVEQISELSPGNQIELPENAYRHILLNINGITIAQGELVKIGDKLAVEIQRTYSKQE